MNFAKKMKRKKVKIKDKGENSERCKFGTWKKIIIEFDLINKYIENDIIT